MDFGGKSILITGASSGIGIKLAEKLSKENCKLALLARSIDKLKDFTKAHSTGNNIILPIYCDVSNKEDVKRGIEEAVEGLGGIDIAILNAATSERGNLEEMQFERGVEIIKVNLIGNIYFLGELIPYFLKKGNGIIAGVSSQADVRGFPRSEFYNASKAGFSRLLEGMRVELKNSGVKIITIRPGFVKTPMTDKNEFWMPLLMSADKAAEIILDGIRKEKKRIQFPALTVLGTKILEAIPNAWFEYFSRKHLDGLKRKKVRR